jgi:hypothetical protein
MAVQVDGNTSVKTRVVCYFALAALSILQMSGGIMRRHGMTAGTRWWCQWWRAWCLGCVLAYLPTGFIAVGCGSFPAGLYQMLVVRILLVGCARCLQRRDENLGRTPSAHTAALLSPCFFSAPPGPAHAPRSSSSVPRC